MYIHRAIEQKLTIALVPTYLRIADESSLHSGHVGTEGVDFPHESHFRVFIVSERFKGMQRVARQRMVYDLLRRELRGHIHALSMQTLTPEEFSLQRAT